MESKVERNMLLSSLLKIGHAPKHTRSQKFSIWWEMYGEVGRQTMFTDPELYHRLIAWNVENSAVHDLKMAMPVIGLRMKRNDRELAENSVAALISLPPHQLVQAYSFNKYVTANHKNIPFRNRKLLQFGMIQYLVARERNPGWWTSSSVRARDAMRTLYAVTHKTPTPMAQAVLFERKYERGTVFDVIRNLRDMPPDVAAGHIINMRIPVPVAIGAVASAKDKNLWLAMLKLLTRNELVNYTEMMQRLGLFDDPVLLAAYEEACERTEKEVHKGKSIDALKADKAIQAVSDKAPEAIINKLRGVKQKNVESLPQLEGNLAILADMSGSMSSAIELAKQIAAVVSARSSSVHLVFFNTIPRAYEVAGKSLDEIQSMTGRIYAHSGTSIGIGLQYLLDRGQALDTIIIVSDGGENSPPYFTDVYQSYAQTMGIQPIVAFFCLRGEPARLIGEPYSQLYSASRYQSLDKAGIMYDLFDLREGEVDYYSLPNLLKVIGTKRFEFLDNIMNTELLTIKGVTGLSDTY